MMLMKMMVTAVKVVMMAMKRSNKEVLMLMDKHVVLFMLLLDIRKWSHVTQWVQTHSLILCSVFSRNNMMFSFVLHLSLLYKAREYMKSTWYRVLSIQYYYQYSPWTKSIGFHLSALKVNVQLAGTNCCCCISCSVVLFRPKEYLLEMFVFFCQ